MFNRTLTSRLYHRVCCLVLFFMAAAASFNGFYVACHFHEVGVVSGWAPDSFERMVDGTADRPYVYRQMLPTVSNWIDRAIPQSIKTRLYDHQGSVPNAYFSVMSYSPTARNKAYFFRYLVVYLSIFLSALLAVYAMYFVCKALEVPDPAAVVAPVVVILLVPYVMDSSGFIYDYPELAFLALAVWTALKFNWWWTIPVAALGAWNKESFLLIIPTLYPFLRRRSSRLAAFVGVAALCSVCAAVYFPIRLRFAHNPGADLYMGWQSQLQSLSYPRILFFSTQETYGVRMIKACSAAPLALLIWTVWRAWKRLPHAIQRHAQIAAAINIPLYLLFCSAKELRDLSMLYIVLLLVLAVNLNDWIGGSERVENPKAD